MKLNTFLLLITLILFIGLIVYKPKKVEKIEILRIDTVTIVKPAEKIVIIKAKPKVIYRRDTIIQTMPFVASLDTIVAKDTIEAEYRYPENVMNLRILRSTDTFRIPKIVVSEQKQKNNWYEKGMFFLAGATLGILLSKIK